MGEASGTGPIDPPSLGRPPSAQFVFGSTVGERSCVTMADAVGRILQFGGKVFGYVIGDL